MKYKNINNERGFALLISLFVLVMLTTLGTASLAISSNEYHISKSSTKATQAYYLAEAGIEEALYRVENRMNTLELVDEYTPLFSRSASENYDIGSVNVKYKSMLNESKILNTIILKVQSNVEENFKKTLYAKVKLNPTLGDKLIISSVEVSNDA